MMKLINSKANKSGEPNVVWRGNLWLVKIRRRCKTFTANAETIEDAIKIRDKALDYFNNHNEFPTRQQIRAVYKTKNRKTHTEYYCMRCSKVYKFKESSETAQRFMKNGHVCVECMHKRFRKKNVDISGIHHRSDDQTFRVEIVCSDGTKQMTTYSMKAARRIKIAIEEYVEKNKNFPTRKQATVIAEIARKNIGNRGNSKT